jgi:xylan 1,4-beta-xylosidase
MFDFKISKSFRMQKTYSLLQKIMACFSMLLLSSCIKISENSKHNKKENIAAFDWFRYEGNDAIYKTLSADKEKYLNPILAGFYPDPGICRVHDKFYLVNSSFSYFPGLPIFESTDMVNWKQIGHVIDRPEQLDLKLAVSKGLYAPTIRYNKRFFYVVCTNVDAGGNFLVTAKNPAGPWSNPIWLPEIEGIDPDIYFDDDGKVYITHNGPPPNNISVHEGHRAIYMMEFDLEKSKTVGESKLVVNGGTDMSQEPVWIEGPHIIKKDGFYYMICAQGGTEYNHSEVVFRSEHIFGPYSSFPNNPILTQKHLDKTRANPVTTTGHADFVELSNGDWWSVFLGCRPYGDDLYNTGRETFMLPVKWKDGWPEIVGGKEPIPFQFKKPNLCSSKENISPMNGNFIWQDDFNSDKLDFKWNFIRTPSEKWYSLEKGKLLIKARKETIQTETNFSFIGRRQQHLNFDVSTKVDFKLQNQSQTSGLLAFQNEKSYFLLGNRLNDSAKQKVFVERVSKILNNEKREIVAETDLQENSDSVLYRIEGNAGLFNFYFKENENDSWILLLKNSDATILSTKLAGGFVGTYLGMYTSGNHFSTKE